MLEIKAILEELKVDNQISKSDYNKVLKDFKAAEKSGALAETDDEDDELIVEPFNEVNIIPDCKVFKNQRIKNPTDTWHFVHDVTLIYPLNLQGIVNAIKYAEKHNLKIRPIGSRHSFSNIMQTRDCYIDLTLSCPYKMDLENFKPRNHNTDVLKLDQSAINRVVDNPKNDLNQTIAKENLIDIPATLRVWALNHILCPDNNDTARFGKKRLFNMGGGDVQHFAGAFSTGTHGSGGVYSAYHDMIRSFVIVGSGGKVYRVEPTKGITNPDKHQAFYDANPNEVKVQLLQSDELFYAALVNMGCFGIFYSCIIEITDMKELYEEAIYTKGSNRDRNIWNEDIKNEMKKGVFVAPGDHYRYIQINPYKQRRKKHHSYLEKKVVSANSNTPNGKKVSNRPFWPSIFGKLNISVALTRFLANRKNMAPVNMIETALSQQNNHSGTRGLGYKDLSYKIFNAGTGKLKNVGVGIEFCFPTKKIPEILDFIFEYLAYHDSRIEGYYLNAPIALRFSRPSKAYLANSYHTYQGEIVAEWCYIELLRVTPKKDFRKDKELELFSELQTLLANRGGRPHWGLNFNYKFGEEFLSRIYPKFDLWLKALLFFNDSGVFDNEFMKIANLREAAERRFPQRDVIV